MPVSQSNAGRLTKQQSKPDVSANGSNPTPLPSASPTTVPINQTLQTNKPPAKAEATPELAKQPRDSNNQNEKTKAATKQTAPEEARPQKKQAAAKQQEHPKSPPVTTTMIPAPSQEPSASDAVQTPGPTAQPIADTTFSDSLDYNRQNDVERFNPTEISIMQMRMGIEADSATAADHTATKNEETKAEKIVLSDDNFAITMGEIFTNPAVYSGNKLETTGFVLHNKNLPEDEAFIVRYVITCCIADATPTFVIAKSNELKSLTDDTWVTVSGTLANNSNTKWTFAPFMTLSDLNIVHAPKDPYAYY